MRGVRSAKSTSSQLRGNQTAASLGARSHRETRASGEMFADGVRLNGLKVLASHRIAEGIQACANYLRDQNPWSSENRTPEILKILERYGAEAQRIVPHLRETADLFDKGEKDFPRRLSKMKAKAVRQAIEDIDAAQDRPDLRKLK